MCIRDSQKPICDFLLVINTNLHPISHRFEVIADLLFRQRGTHLWHIRLGWTPKRRITKFGLKKLETLLYRMVLKYRQTIVSFCHNPRVWQMDGRTDRRTDGQTSIARPCVCVRSHTVKTGGCGQFASYGAGFWSVCQGLLTTSDKETNPVDTNKKPRASGTSD